MSSVRNPASPEGSLTGSFSPSTELTQMVASEGSTHSNAGKTRFETQDNEEAAFILGKDQGKVTGEDQGGNQGDGAAEKREGQEDEEDDVMQARGVEDEARGGQADEDEACGSHGDEEACSTSSSITSAEISLIQSETALLSAKINDMQVERKMGETPSALWADWSMIAANTCASHQSDSIGDTDDADNLDHDNNDGTAQPGSRRGSKQKYCCSGIVYVVMLLGFVVVFGAGFVAGEAWTTSWTRPMPRPPSPCSSSFPCPSPRLPPYNTGPDPDINWDARSDACAQTCMHTCTGKAHHRGSLGGGRNSSATHWLQQAELDLSAFDALARALAPDFHSTREPLMAMCEYQMTELLQAADAFELQLQRLIQAMPAPAVPVGPSLLLPFHFLFFDFTQLSPHFRRNNLALDRSLHTAKVLGHLDVDLLQRQALVARASNEALLNATLLWRPSAALDPTLLPSLGTRVHISLEKLSRLLFDIAATKHRILIDLHVYSNTTANFGNGSDALTAVRDGIHDMRTAWWGGDRFADRIHTANAF